MIGAVLRHTMLVLETPVKISIALPPQKHTFSAFWHRQSSFSAIAVYPPLCIETSVPDPGLGFLSPHSMVTSSVASFHWARINVVRSVRDTAHILSFESLTLDSDDLCQT